MPLAIIRVSRKIRGIRDMKDIRDVGVVKGYRYDKIIVVCYYPVQSFVVIFVAVKDVGYALIDGPHAHKAHRVALNL